MPFSFERRIKELKDYSEGKTSWIDVRKPYLTAQEEYNVIKTLV